MAATKLQANWATVAHGSTAITKVTNVTITPGGSVSDFAGDADTFPTVVAVLANRPKVTVTTGDESVAMGLAPGTIATFTATHKDARLAMGGDILYTVINCVVENPEAGGAHGAFGSGSISFMAFSSDGTTSPISFTRA